MDSFKIYNSKLILRALKLKYIFHFVNEGIIWKN